MALGADKFARGMTTLEYIDRIKVNKQPFQDIYHAVEVPSEVAGFFGGLREPLRLAVFTADWCGDALSTTPAVLKLADGCPNLEPRVFNRDEELALTDSFLPEHRAGTVPVFVVFDSAMNEVARFIETARKLVPSIDAMDQAVEREAQAEGGDNPRAVMRGKRTAFRVARAREWGEVILQEFRQVVDEGLSLPPDRRPAEGGTEWPPPQD